MINCKFFNSDCKCDAINKFSHPSGASVMGYCMAVVNRLEECDWFTEEKE